MMELYNVELVSKGADWAVGRFAGEGLVQGTKKVQWVIPASSQMINVLEPSELYNEDGTFNTGSLNTRSGFVEQSFRDLVEGDIVQFPRYGFVRVDAPNRCVLAHN
jgi:hypothetical protein